MKREEVFLLRLPLLRLRFRRREWEKVRRLRIGLGCYMFHVDVVLVEEPTVKGGARRWLRCACGRHTSVLGVALTTGRFGCRSCVPWRSRSKAIESPGVAHAAAAIEPVLDAEGVS